MGERHFHSHLIRARRNETGPLAEIRLNVCQKAHICLEGDLYGISCINIPICHQKLIELRRGIGACEAFLSPRRRRKKHDVRHTVYEKIGNILPPFHIAEKTVSIIRCDHLKRMYDIAARLS